MPFKAGDYGSVRCKNCGVRFKKQHPKQVFHSDTCRQEFWRTGGVSFSKYEAMLDKKLKAKLPELADMVVSRLLANKEPPGSGKLAQRAVEFAREVMDHVKSEQKR